MKVTYSADVDVVRILLRDTPIEESNEEKPGVIFDYDKDGHIVGIELLNASQQVQDPRAIEYALLGVT
jgi:uncharacterized protein YuzE